MKTRSQSRRAVPAQQLSHTAASMCQLHNLEKKTKSDGRGKVEETKDNQTSGGTPKRSQDVGCMTECIMDVLPRELKCRILSNLCIVDICKMCMMNRTWRDAVSCHLSLVKTIDFSYNKRSGPTRWYPVSRLNDHSLKALIDKCPSVERILNFHPEQIISSVVSRGFILNALGVNGISEIFRTAKNLKEVGISDLLLLESIGSSCPRITVPVFANNNGSYPPPFMPVYQLSATYRISELELFGITVNWTLPLATSMYHLTKFHVQCVRFLTGLKRGARFHCPNLKSFMMSNCLWPLVEADTTYGIICTGLASCKQLEVLHLVGNAIDTRLLRRIVETNWQRFKPFQKLKKIVLASNPLLHEDDMGVLIIASQKHLETLHIQKTLSKDVVMVALETASPDLWSLKSLKLGYVDELSPRDHYDYAQRLTSLDEDFDLMVDNRPCQLSDCGIRSAAAAFLSPDLESVSVNECPYLNNAMLWIPQQGLELSIWNDLTDLTLSRCPTLSLEKFNQFMNRLTNLKILNLYHMFPAPPKGCARVGLSAGMNIGGPQGIRAIISQPPVPDNSSLLTFPTISVDELMKMNDIPDSDDEDTTVVADTSQGYRNTQCHASCSTNMARIRRGFIRNEKQLLDKKRNASKAKPKDGQADLRRYHCKPRRTSSYPRRQSKRLRNQERQKQGLFGLSLSSSSSEDDESENNDRDRQEDVNADNSRCSTPDMIPPPGYERPDTHSVQPPIPDTNPPQIAPPPPPPPVSPLQGGNARQSGVLHNTTLVNNQTSPTAQARIPAENDQPANPPITNDWSVRYPRPSIRSVRALAAEPDSDEESPSTAETQKKSERRCVVCGRSLPQTAVRGEVMPIAGIQLSTGVRPKACRESVISENSICKECVKERMKESRESSKYPSDSQLSASHTHRQEDSDEWIVFDSVTGLSRLCRRDNQRLAKSHGLMMKRCSNKGKAPLKPSSAIKVKGQNGRLTARQINKKEIKRPNTDSSTSKGVSKAKRRRTAVKHTDQCVGTEDPFIEPDTQKVLEITNDWSQLECINLIDTGFTKMNLAGCHRLNYLTAHACSVLREVKFSTTARSLKRNEATRITQCPKLSFPGLLRSISERTITLDASRPAPIRVVEFEPVKSEEYDREEALLELSEFRENNKILIESHVEAGSDLPETRSYYEQLISLMNGSGNASYIGSEEFKIYAEEADEGRFVICHNIPQCSVRITPYCDLSPSIERHHRSQSDSNTVYESECETSTAQGHILRGGSVLCFIHPTREKESMFD